MFRHEQQRHGARTTYVAAIVIAALASGAAIAAEYPSEMWSPYPSNAWAPKQSTTAVPEQSEAWSPKQSETWSPRVASLPAPPVKPQEKAAKESELPAPSSTPHFNSPVFGSPPLPGDANWDEQPVVGPNTPCTCEPPCEAWHVQSYYIPSLGRFGLIAPRTPGAESVHSAYVLMAPGRPSPYANLFTPPPANAPSPCTPIFAPPPCPAAGASKDDAPTAGTLSRTPGAAPGVPSDPPCIDGRAQLSPYSSNDFTPDSNAYWDKPYDPGEELGIYGGKYLIPTQRPLVEWGFPLYDTGPVPPPSLEFGVTNPSLPRFYIYGDYRAAVAYNDQNANAKGVIADRLNLEWDLWLTSTERFHMFTGPFQRGNDFQRVEFNNGNVKVLQRTRFLQRQYRHRFLRRRSRLHAWRIDGQIRPVRYADHGRLDSAVISERHLDERCDRRRRNDDPGPQQPRARLVELRHHVLRGLRPDHQPGVRKQQLGGEPCSASRR